MTDEKVQAQIDFHDPDDVTNHVWNLLHTLRDHYGVEDVGGLLAISLMTHLSDCNSRPLFEMAHRYLDETLTTLWYKIENPDHKTITSPLASRHFH
jgi:hypothetical protein